MKLRDTQITRAKLVRKEKVLLACLSSRDSLNSQYTPGILGSSVEASCYIFETPEGEEDILKSHLDLVGVELELGEEIDIVKKFFLGFRYSKKYRKV